MHRRKNNRMGFRYLLPTIFIMIGISLVACKKTNEQAYAEETQADGSYKTMAVTKSDRVLLDSYSAIIRGRQDIEIYPQISGILTALHVKEGEVVKEGQLLFTIDEAPYQIALTQAQATVQSAEAALSTAKLAYEGRLELYREKVISAFELQSYKNAMHNAEAALAEAKANELNARNNLSYTIIKSPSNGVIGMLPYRQGSLVNPDMAAPLTTVSDNTEVYVYFSMDENLLLGLVRQYGSVELALQNLDDVRLLLSDGSTYAQTGQIESISGVIDQNTGSVSLRAKFPNHERLLFSGATGVIQLPVKYSDMFVIPQGATMQLQDKYIVYKVIDGKAVSALITVSPINDGREYIVQSGLMEGDEIVAEGAGFVQEGTVVK